MRNYKSMIIKTSIFTLLTMIGLTILLSLIMTFIFPKNFGDFFYNLGNTDISSELYYRAYQKDKDINLCYKALSVSISGNHNQKVVDYYAELENHEDYEDFIVSIKNKYENLSIAVLEKSALLNEEQYLKNAYIRALILTNNELDAYAKSLKYFEDYNSFEFKKQGVYTLHYFVDNSSIANFETVPQGFSLTLIESMQDYFDKSIELFNANKNANTNLDKAYLLALGNRIITVGQNVNKVYTNLNTTTLCQSNIDKILQINEILKGLI